jgi:S-adenosylmethionine-diacylglycerol 3-amino-3-carboxypropyl transferase
MPAKAHGEILAQVAKVSRPGARIAYWNLFVDRQCPADLADRVEVDMDGGAALLARDRAFFYQAFRLETVR